MTDWSKQRTISDVAIGDALGPITIPLTLQRLVMEAGANRDFSTIHHGRDDARATGADDVYANTFFLLGMFERTVREWCGLKGKITKIGPMQMKNFNCVGEVLTFSGEVTAVDQKTGEVEIDLWADSDRGRTTLAKAKMLLPK